MTLCTSVALAGLYIGLKVTNRKMPMAIFSSALPLEGGAYLMRGNMVSVIPDIVA